MFSIVRKISYIAFVAFILTACGESGSAESTDLQVSTYLNLADVYRQQGQFRASLIEVQNALQLNPDNIDTQLFMGSILMELGDYTAAVGMLRTASENSADNIPIKLLLAEALLYTRGIQEGEELLSELGATSPEQEVKKNWLLGNFEAVKGNNDRAEEIFQDILDSNPSHLDTLISQARLKYSEGDSEAADLLTRNAISTEGSADNIDLWIWRGQLATLKEDYPTAEDAFYEALDIMSLYDTMTIKRFSTLQSILLPLRMQQKNDEALRYSEIIANTPIGQLQTAYSNAVSLIQQGGLQQAETALQSTLDLAPNHPGSNILMGLARYQQGDYQEAERLLSEYVDINSASSELVQTLAASYLKLNDLEGAYSVLEQAAQNFPEDTSIMAMLSIVEQARGNNEAAVSQMERALELNRESPQLYLALAELQTRMGDTANAIESLTTAIGLDAEFDSAKSALLSIRLNQGELSEAESLIEEWLEQNPDSIFNNISAGAIALEDGNFGNARSYFSRVIDIDPENIQGMLNLSRVEVLDENYSDAEDIYNDILAMQPMNTNAMGGILALAELRGNPEQGESRLQEIINNNPDEFIPSAVLGQYHLIKGQLNDALGYAEASYAIANNQVTKNLLFSVTMQMAVVETRNQNNQEALALLESLLDMDNQYPPALELAARIEGFSENFESANNYLERLKSVLPNQVATHELEGDMLLLQNNNTGALEAYQNAWNLQNSDNLGLKIHSSYTAMGDSQGLENFLGDWIEDQPGNTTPVLLKAMQLQGTGQDQESIRYYEEVYRVQPENGIVLNNLAWLYQDSDPERAIELASSAAALYPDNADILDTYGWILLKQDNRDQAIEMFERAIELAPDSQPIRDHLNEAQQN